MAYVGTGRVCSFCGGDENDTDAHGQHPFAAYPQSPIKDTVLRESDLLAENERFRALLRDVVSRMEDVLHPASPKQHAAAYARMIGSFLDEIRAALAASKDGSK